MNKAVMLGKGRSLCPISHSEFIEDVAFYCFEPKGLYGRWLIIKNYWKIFPLNPAEVKRVAWIRR
jgi:hypothetical protein